jgi:hypothetical protein
MPEITRCPDCSKNLRVPDDLLGKKVRCPGCNIMFVAQVGAGVHEHAASSAPAPAPRSPAYNSEFRSGPPAPSYQPRYDDRPPPPPRRDEEYDRDRDYDRDRPRYRDDFDDGLRRPPRDLAKSWRGVRMGLNLVLIGSWLNLAMWGVIIIGAGLFLLAGVSLFGSVASASTPDRMARNAFGGIAGIGLGILLFGLVVVTMDLAEVVLRLIGYGMCMQVPSNRDSGAKPFAIAAFSCAAGAVFLNFVAAGFSGVDLRGGFPALMFAGYSNAFGWLASLVALAGFVCWLIFLRCVAVQLRNSEVASRVIIYLICLLISWFVARAMMVLIFVVMFASSLSAIFSGSVQGAARSVGAGFIVSLFLGAVIFLGYLALEVWHILLVQQVRGLVDRHLARL